MKKLLSVLLCVILALSLTACSNSGGTPSEANPASDQKPKTLTIGAEREAATFDPLLTGSAEVGYAMMASGVMNLLWWMDSSGKMVYALGTGYEYNDDLTELTIHLRKGVKFQNGNDWNAEDLLYNLRRAAASAQNAQRVASLDLKNSYAADDYTVVLKVKTFEASFAESLSATLFYMLDKEWCEEVGEKGIGMSTNGTGPYILSKWNVGTSYVLTRNKNYWGEAPYYDEIVIRFIAESSTRMMEFETGTLDVAYVTTVQEVNNLKSGYYKGASNLSVPLQSSAGFTFNLRDQSDMWPIEMRQAIAHAIDVKTIVSAVGGDLFAVATSVEPSANWAYLNTGTYKYDPDLSRQKLKEAGISNFSFTVHSRDSGYAAAVLEAIQGDLSKVGITMKIEKVDSTVFRSMLIAGKTVAAIGGSMGAAGVGDPGDVFRPHEKGSGNSLMEKSGEVADMITKAKSEPDRTKRIAMYHEIQQYYHDNYLYIPILETTYNYGVKDNVVGFKESLDALAIPVLAAIKG